MLDHFLLLTPLLLLPVVALLAFAGCYTPVTLVPAPLTHKQTVVNFNGPGTDSITADPLELEGGELIIAAVQWSSAISGPDMPQLSGAVFSPLSGVSAFQWNNMLVQIFTAMNPTGAAASTKLAVTATLLRPSIIKWNLCVSAYSGADPGTPVYSPLSSDVKYVGNNPHTASLGILPGDLVYAVAFAADSDGAFPGNGNSLTPGPGFTAVFPDSTNPLVESGDGSSPVTAQATNANPDLNAKGFIFAMGVRSVSQT
jgi:hypothetical protein